MLSNPRSPWQGIRNAARSYFSTMRSLSLIHILVSTQNLRLGVLRLQELLNHLNAGSTQMERLVDELATAQLDDYKKLYLKDREIKNIIIVDDYLSPWAVRKAHERGEVNAVVDRKAFSQLMEALRTKGTTELAKRMDIAEEKVPLVYILSLIHI